VVGLIDAATKQPFTCKDPCVELDPHLATDLAATADAKMRVKAFLNNIFKLN